jgi:hypothetical protein
MSKEEVIGSNKPEIKLTSTQRMVVKHMQKGLVLILNQRKEEFLSYHVGKFKGLPAFTVEGMVKKKLVEKSPFSNTRYYLTHIGRHIKTN